MQYKTCEYCQSNLDPGETCDCKEAREVREVKKDQNPGEGCPGSKEGEQKEDLRMWQCDCPVCRGYGGDMDDYGSEEEEEEEAP